MDDQLAPGLHEALITRELRDRIERARADGWLVEWQDVDDARLAAILARHVHDRAREAIERVPSTVADRRHVRVELVNRALEVLAEYGATTEGADAIDPEATLLMEVGAPGRVDSTPTPRPGIPLRDSALLVNGHKDLQIGTQVPLEILSADRIDLLCAFVRFAGVRLMRRELQEFLLRGGQMRVIASVYTGSTEKRAMHRPAALRVRTLIILGAVVALILAIGAAGSASVKAAPKPKPTPTPVATPTQPHAATDPGRPSHGPSRLELRHHAVPVAVVVGRLDRLDGVALPALDPRVTRGRRGVRRGRPRQVLGALPAAGDRHLAERELGRR
jgi:hypothetical protein